MDTTKLPAKLPTIEELTENRGVALRDTQLNILLNSAPHPSWVKKHPVTKAGYLPIGQVEYLLTAIFGRWRVEVKDVQLIGNSVTCTVRLHYLHPDGSWDWQDGVGSAPLQTDSGAGAIEFNKLKSAAVQMAAPIAKSMAIKDAAEELGRIFGRDLKRTDVVDYGKLSDKVTRLEANLMEGGQP